MFERANAMSCLDGDRLGVFIPGSWTGPLQIRKQFFPSQMPCRGRNEKKEKEGGKEQRPQIRSKQSPEQGLIWLGTSGGKSGDILCSRQTQVERPNGAQ